MALHVPSEAEVESLNVHLHIVDHLGPVVLLAHVGLPALQSLLDACLREDGRIMHHFLRNAANIDARSSEAPLGSDGSRRDKISDADLLAEFRGGFGSRQTA